MWAIFHGTDQLDPTLQANVGALDVVYFCYMANKNAKTSNPTSRKKKIITWVIAVGLAVLLLTPFVNSYTLRKSLESESKTQLAESYSGFVHDSEKFIDTTSQTLQVPPNISYSATYTTCYTDHDDSGWFATDYNYNCLLVRYAFLEVPSDSTLQRTVEQQAEPSSIGSSSDFFGNIYELYTYGDKFESVFPGTRDLPIRLLVVMKGTYSDVNDVLDVGVVSSLDTVVSYAERDATANRKLVESSGEISLDPQKTYVVLHYEKAYLERDIGCRMPSFIFCESPI